MKMKMFLLLLAAVLALSGCASILDRSYESVRPHTSQYWQDAQATAMRAEDYQGLVNGLLLLVSGQKEEEVVYLYGYPDRTAAIEDMDRACAEVTMEDPLGSYLVDYITYDCAESTNSFEMTVRFTYQKTSRQMADLVNATTAGAIPELLRSALNEGRTELAVKVHYMDLTADEIRSSVSAVMEEVRKQEGDCSVQFYPDSGDVGDTRIVEVVWARPELPVPPAGLTPEVGIPPMEKP